MDTQALKTSVLQLAMQGKLVEQRPKEGTGEELYRQIQKEKAELIKQGKIKKEMPLPEITDDEKPFDIPENWKWVRLDEIVDKQIKRGKSPTYAAKSGTLVFAQKCNTKKGYIDISLALYLDEAKLSKYPEEEFMRDKDIVINSTGGGTMGRIGFYNTSDNPDSIPIVPDSHVTVVRMHKYVNATYAYYVLKTYQPYLEKQLVGSTNQTELNAATIRSLLISLPPLAEQKRIVEKLDSIMALIDRYEQARGKLQELGADTEKALLQLAMQGKLVEQRPEEGTGEELYRQIQKEKAELIKQGKIKKEKLLPEITDDEKPFDIPENWIWVRIGNIGSWSAGATPSRTNPEYYGGNIPWLKTGDLNDGMISEIPETITELALMKTSVRLNPVGSVLMAMYGATIGKLGILAVESTTNQACCACIPYMGIYNKYLFYYLLGMRKAFIKMGEGGAQPNISKEKIVNALISLPPLAEQKRIIAKLEELLPLCERLK